MPQMANAPTNTGDNVSTVIDNSPIDEVLRVDDLQQKIEGTSDSPIQRIDNEAPIESFISPIHDVFAGGGADLNNLTESEINRIQDIANYYDIEINLVGSRAEGTADENSDYDYIINGGNSKKRSSALYRLPRNPKANKEGEMRPGSEILRHVDVDETRPFIRFKPVNNQ